MTADLVFRRISPPEFSHSKRLPTVPVGILQELGSRTLTCTCRWRLLDGIFKQVAQIPFLPAGVQHAELFEKPLLKGSRTGLAFCFEAFDFRLEHLYFRLEGGKVIFPILFLPFQFRFLELAFTDQLLRIYPCDGRTQPVTFNLSRFHPSPYIIQNLSGKDRLVSQPLLAIFISHICLQLLDPPVDSRYLFFFDSEKAIWLLHVINRRHEISVSILPCQDAREGCQIADFPLSCTDNQNAKHLPFPQFSLPFSLCRQIAPDLARCRHTKGMRGIMERIGKLFRQREKRNRICKIVKFVHAFSESKRFIRQK